MRRKVVKMSELPFKFIYRGKEYLIKKSTRKNKQLMSVDKKTGFTVHFGDPNMKEFPGTIREERFCQRTDNIRNKNGNLTKNNPKFANFWNRRITWICRGKKSFTKKKR